VRRSVLLLAAVLAVAPARMSEAIAAPIAPVIADIPAGDYVLDKAHSHITFRISHLYVSSYAAHFTRFDARLHLDPVHPDRASIATTIDPNSLVLDTAPAGFRDLLLGPVLLDVKKFPAIAFQSTGVTMAAPDTARVMGNLSAHGVTRPVALTVTFTGGTRAAPPERRARVAFTVKGKFKRSAFGLGYGSRLIAGDTVQVEIDAQFTCTAASK